MFLLFVVQGFYYDLMLLFTGNLLENLVCI